MWVSVLVTAVAAYLLGNLNGSVLISKLVAHDDVRRHGSGNAGFTNFFRNYGGYASFIVIAIDAAKAVAACLLGGALLGKYGFRPEGMTLGAIMVCIGHDFPALLGFRGGKGIMSGFAAVLTVDWRIGAVVFAGFALIYLLTYYVSLSSIAGAIIYVIGFAVLYHDRPVAMVLGASVGILALYMHRENMSRLIHGQERKTNFFQKGNRE